MVEWPWARIRRLENRCRRLQAELDITTSQLKHALEADTALRLATQVHTQNTELVQLVAQLRRDGFDAPDPVKIVAQVDKVDDLPLEVLDAIEKSAAPGSKEYYTMIREAKGELARDRDPKEVADSFLRGAPFIGW